MKSRNLAWVQFVWASQEVLAVKNSSANNRDVRDAGSIPGLGRSSGEGTWQSTPVFLPGKSRGQRSLTGYSPWGCKESDTTKHSINAPNSYFDMYGSLNTS